MGHQSSGKNFLAACPPKIHSDASDWGLGWSYQAQNEQEKTSRANWDASYQSTLQGITNIDVWVSSKRRRTSGDTSEPTNPRKRDVCMEHMKTRWSPRIRMLTRMLMAQMSKQMDMQCTQHFSAIVYLNSLVHISPVTSLQCGVESVECGV